LPNGLTFDCLVEAVNVAIECPLELTEAAAELPIADGAGKHVIGAMRCRGRSDKDTTVGSERPGRPVPGGIGANSVLDRVGLLTLLVRRRLDAHRVDKDDDLCTFRGQSYAKLLSVARPRCLGRPV
jgi:hypothetical protein